MPLICFILWEGYFKLSLLTKNRMSIGPRTKWAGVLPLVLPLTRWVTLGQVTNSWGLKVTLSSAMSMPKAGGAGNILQRGGGTGVTWRHGGRETGSQSLHSVPKHKQEYLNTLIQGFPNCASQNLSDYTRLQTPKGRGTDWFILSCGTSGQHSAKNMLS